MRMKPFPLFRFSTSGDDPVDNPCRPTSPVTLPYLPEPLLGAGLDQFCGAPVDNRRRFRAP
jgi:hypothetical protein